MKSQTDTPGAQTSWRGLLHANYLPYVALLCLGVWLNAADSLVTATIMPSIVRDIGGYAYFAWPVAVYLLGAIVAGASAGRISEMIGLKAALISAAVFYAAGCVIGALSPDIAFFLAGRLLQGLGAGWISGFVYVAVNSAFPKTLWTHVLAMLAGVWGVATLLGPGFGGIFAEAGIWRMTYWAFAAMALVFAAAAFVLVPHDAPSAPGGKLPFARLTVLAAAILLVADAGTRGGFAVSISMLVVGLFLLALFVRFDARAERGLLPRQLSQPRSASGAGYRTMFLASAGAVGFSIYGAALLQTLYGLSPLEAGYVIGAEAAGWTFAALLVASAAEQWHGVFIRIGASAILAGLLALACAFPSGNLVFVIAAATLMGSGFGLMWAFITRRIFENLPPDETARGSSAVPAVQIVGNAVGAAFAGAVANLLGMAGGLTVADAERIGLWLFVLSAPLALFAWLSANRLAGFAPVKEPAAAE